MSKQTFPIEQSAIVNEIIKFYNGKPNHFLPVAFNSHAMYALLKMQESTHDFMQYKWCQGVVDDLLTLLSGYLFSPEPDGIEFSKELDSYGLPQTVTLSREEASGIFYTTQHLITYLCEMDRLNDLFERSTKDHFAL